MPRRPRRRRRTVRRRGEATSATARNPSRPAPRARMA